jgi:phenylacetate-CoA ligase
MRGILSERLLMPFLLRFSNCPPWPWYEKLLKHEHAERSDLKRIQMDGFRAIFNYARQTVPYYEESFAKAGLRSADIATLDDLLRIPTIGKHQISANFPDRITARGSNRDTWQYFATSGTTDRLMVVKDAEAMSRNFALALYEERIQGTYRPGSLRVNIPPDACSLACATAVRRSQRPLDRAREAVGRLMERKIGSLPRSMAGHIIRKIAEPEHEMHSFGPEGTRISSELLDLYVEEIRRRRPFVLSGLPTYLLLLARHIERSGKLPPEIGSLLPQGASSTTALKKEIGRVFGVPVHEVYGGHEFGCVASTCESGDRLHLLMPECLVEIVRNGEHVAPGEPGEIVITSFSNHVMPLIRYRPGDVGRLHEDYCSCGRKTQLLTLEGRMEDTLVTSKGLRTEKEITEFLMKWPNVEFFQLVQRNDTKCDLLIVEREDGLMDLKDLAEAMNSFLGDEMSVRPRLVSTIKPEVSGKFRFVKSNSFMHFHTDDRAGRAHQLEMAVGEP